MDPKDQRLEVRVSLQQLEKLDTIRNAVDSNYTPTRSDVVRSFIDQGIDHHLNGGEHTSEAIPLAQRLSLYFQLHQIYLIGSQLENPRPYSKNTLAGSHHQKSDISELDLVRQVYLNRMHWFFELNSDTLKSIHRSLASIDLISLLNSEASISTCHDFAHVNELIKMFMNIETIVQDGNKYDQNPADIKILSKIELLSERFDIPLKFMGFPENRTQLAEMASLLNWFYEGKSRYYCTIQTSTKDYTLTYKTMLKVYQKKTHDGRKLTLTTLMEMLDDRRIEST